MRRFLVLFLVFIVMSPLFFLAGCSSGSSGSNQQQTSSNVPVVTAVSPSSLNAGAATQTITITGTGFVSGSVVSFSGTVLQTTYNSATSLQATLPAALIAGGQVASVTVSNGSGASSSSPVNFSVMAPTPQVAGISPNNIPQAAAAVLQINGTGFEANSQVLWNGSARPTTFVSSTSLQVSIGVADTASVGSVQITVNNPGPGGSTTSAASIAIYPVPTIISLSPTSLPAGPALATLTVTGSNFVSGSSVTLDGTSLVTTYVSDTTLRATVTASLLASSRTASVTVRNPSPMAAESAPASLPINAPNPVLTLISPVSVPSGTSGTVTLTGSGFLANSIAQWNGSARSTVYVTTTSIRIVLTAADLASSGTGQITVNNPGPGGGTSSAQTLNIVTPPSISSVSPTTVQVPASNTTTTPITINGSDFASAATAYFNGYKLTITAQTSSQITATIPGNALYTTGAAKVYIYNPAPGNTSIASQPASVNVINPNATFSVSPSGAVIGSPDTKISIYGSGFFADSVVQWNGTPLVTTYGSATSLTAIVPASYLATLGNAVISVNTPENLGQASPTQGFSTYLNLPVNDLAWNATDGLIYGTISSSAGTQYGNSLVGIDPITGAVKKTIFVGSEPNRIAISTDGTQAMVGLDGAAAVRQINLSTATAGVQVSLGGGPGIYNPPYTASDIAAVPGQPNSFAVYATNGVITIYDSGVARPKTSSGLSTYFYSNSGGLSFGSSASTLYLSSSSAGNYVYALTVDSTGIVSYKQLSTTGSGKAVQYDNGRLYFPNGTVADANTGSSVGQFSVPGSSPAVAASGAIVSESALNRAWMVLSNYSSPNQIVAYDETTFSPVVTFPFGNANTGSLYPSDLIRWGQNGLAFHTGSQLYILQGSVVKDTSSSPVDIKVTATAPASSTTGTSFATQFQVANAGANSAQGVLLTATLPSSVIYGSVTPTQGSCSGAGTIYCNLGTIASGASATVTLNGTPSTSGATQITGIATTLSFDSNNANNQATASTTVTGSLFSPVPTISALSTNMVAAGGSTFTLTVTGTGFTSASTVNWNGNALSTSVVSGTSLTATVDASLLKDFGWAAVNVSSAAPGGGASNALTLNIYKLLSVPANAMVYDPFTRKLWAVLPSTSTSPAGNSIVSVDPNSGTVGTPVQIGSEPNVLAETSSGNYIYVGLSGAKSLGRFNMKTQTLDLTVPLATTGFFGGPIAANGVTTIPGVDNSVAVPNVGIIDISGSAATVRSNSALNYNNAVFTDSGHAFTYDNQSSGAEFYRYTVDSAGAHLVDGTTLNGMGGFSGGFTIEGNLGYGGAGGIFNPFSTTPTQVGKLTLGSGPYGTGLSGGGVIPYATQKKAFLTGVNTAGTWLLFSGRFDTEHFLYEDQIQFPTTNVILNSSGTRWGQDGLAYILAGTSSSSPSQILLVRGPFVLPTEASTNAAPSLTSVGTGTVAVGSGNQKITVTGSSFLPGASVIWNGVVHDTTYVDSNTLTVAVGASEVNAAATVTVTCRNPGSVDSNSVSVTIQ